MFHRVFFNVFACCVLSTLLLRFRYCIATWFSVDFGSNSKSASNKPDQFLVLFLYSTSEYQRCTINNSLESTGMWTPSVAPTDPKGFQGIPKGYRGTSRVAATNSSDSAGSHSNRTPQMDVAVEYQFGNGGSS